jgi:hypothetical protein
VSQSEVDRAPLFMLWRVPESAAYRQLCAANSAHLVGIINLIHWSKNARIGQPKICNLAFFCPPTIHTVSGAHPASLVSGYRGSFPGVKRPGRDVKPLTSI